MGKKKQNCQDLVLQTRNFYQLIPYSFWKIIRSIVFKLSTLNVVLLWKWLLPVSCGQPAVEFLVWGMQQKSHVFFHWHFLTCFPKKHGIYWDETSCIYAEKWILTFARNNKWTIKNLGSIFSELENIFSRLPWFNRAHKSTRHENS